jgi:hypothetical protein
MFTLGLEEAQFPNYIQCFQMFYKPSQTDLLLFRLQLKLVGINVNVSESWGGEGSCDL